MNLESLRRKRVKRMGIKISMHAGQRRILFVLERATKKFHGDIALWMQYIEFARKQKANKKLSEILTSVLRMHPGNPDLWIYAADYALEGRNDMKEARSYMQRALRFCKNSEITWLEYARLEMIYITRISQRGRALNRNGDTSNKDFVSGADGGAGDIVTLPPIPNPYSDPNVHADDSLDQKILQELEATPVLSGAIPMAIFDGAMGQFPGNSTLGLHFFDIVGDFPGVPCTRSILQHILDHLLAVAPLDSTTLLCFIRQPVIGIETISPDFPVALGVSLNRLESVLMANIPSAELTKNFSCRYTLCQQIIEWILSFIVEGLDTDIHKVLSMTLRKLWSLYHEAIQQAPGTDSGSFAKVFNELQSAGYQDLVDPAKGTALHLWPNDRKLLNLQ